MFQQLSSHLFPIQRVEPLHRSRVQLDGLGDVSQHLFEGVSCLLVQQDSHRLTRLHPAADHRHQLGLDEVFSLPALTNFRTLFGAGGGAHWHPSGCRCWPGRAHHAYSSTGSRFPARDGDLGVVHLSVRLIRSTNIALTWAETEKWKRWYIKLL